MVARQSDGDGEAFLDMHASRQAREMMPKAERTQARKRSLMGFDTAADVLAAKEGPSRARGRSQRSRPTLGASNDSLDGTSGV